MGQVSNILSLEPLDVFIIHLSNSKSINFNRLLKTAKLKLFDMIREPLV